jgi:hypothetical protein
MRCPSISSINIVIIVLGVNVEVDGERETLP